MSTPKKIEDKFTLDDIGASLLEEISKSLYSPAAVIREYLQNAIDAHKQYKNDTGSSPDQAINIEIRKNSIEIIDFGIGMNEDESRLVKQIAKSPKRNISAGLTGRKGVGTWSGLSFFEEMRIETTKEGIAKKYIVIIKFGNIFKDLRGKDVASKSIGEVVDTELYWVPAAEDEHGTVVKLIGPHDEYKKEFLTPSKVEDAVRQFAPCRIDQDWHFKNELESWYYERNIPLFPVRVSGVEVFKTYPNSVAEFATGTISVNDQTIAKVWLAVTNVNRGLSDLHRSSDRPLLYGFRLVQNGFVLGGPNPYSDDFPPLPPIPTNYLDWFVGEFHIDSTNLLPSLNRKELQLDENARLFVGKLRDWYRELEAEARKVQSLRLVTDRFNQHAKITLDLFEGGESVPTNEDENRISNIRTWFSKDAKLLNTLMESAEEGSFPLKEYRQRLIDESKVARKYLLDAWKKLKTVVLNLDGLSAKANGVRKKPSEGPAKEASLDTTNSNNRDGADVNSGDASAPAGAVGNNPNNATGETSRVINTPVNVSGEYLPAEMSLGILNEVLHKYIPDDETLRNKIIVSFRDMIKAIVGNG